MHAISTKIPTPEDRTTFVNHSLSKLSVLVDSSFPVEQRNFRRVSALKRELKDNSLTLLQTDKSGLFAVLSDGNFNEKALVAVSELFVKSDENVAVLKRDVCKILAEEDITATLNRVRGASRSSFGLKFLVKDHKVDFPFRVVINENGSWQKSLAVFLQGCLGHVTLEGSIALRNSEELIEGISPLHRSSCTLMSLDIKDLYYSLDSVLLLERVRELLENNLVSFQAKAGISVDAVLELLTCYLRATVLNFNGDSYIQRKGVCIGSAVAPVLTEFYLNTLD